MSHFVVGLTGGIGSGKSLVSDAFAKQGVSIIDADVVAREVVEPGQPALLEIRKQFGADIICADGTLDRTALRHIVFRQPQRKQWLNALLHPLIRQRMIAQTHDAPSDYCILAVPLLLENNMGELVDRILVVDVDEQTQLRRASSRDKQRPEDIARIMQAQISRDVRLSQADDIIDNSGTPEATFQAVNRLHPIYAALAKNKAKA